MRRGRIGREGEGREEEGKEGAEMRRGGEGKDGEEREGKDGEEREGREEKVEGSILQQRSRWDTDSPPLHAGRGHEEHFILSQSCRLVCLWFGQVLAHDDDTTHVRHGTRQAILQTQ